MLNIQLAHQRHSCSWLLLCYNANIKFNRTMIAFFEKLPKLMQNSANIFLLIQRWPRFFHTLFAVNLAFVQLELTE